MKSIVDQIPDIQYDSIARIVPGVVLLTAYTAHNSNLWGSASYIAAGLILSYVVGFMLELFSATVVDWKFINIVLAIAESPNTESAATVPQKSTNKVVQFIATRCQNIGLVSEARLWGSLRDGTIVKKQLLLKMLAERAMFRSLMIASLVALVIPPKLTVGSVHRAWILGVLLMSMNSFYWVWRFMSEGLKDTEHGTFSSKAKITE